MSATVNVITYQQIMSLFIENNEEMIKHGCRLVPYVWGKHGVGKTQITAGVAEKIWFNYTVLNLANQTPEDLLGYPDGKGGFILPNWFHKRFKEGCRVEFMDGTDNTGDFGTISQLSYDDNELITYAIVDPKPKYNKKGKLEEQDSYHINFHDGQSREIGIRPILYFLDEINRAPKYVLQSMFNFINEGRIHEHKMDVQDFIIAAGNPCDIDYEVTDFGDKAFLSRFCHFYLEPDQEEYIRYLEDNGRHPAVIRTIRKNPDFDGFNPQVGIDARIHTEPDNRALDRIALLCATLEENTIKKLGEIIFSSMVGLDYAAMIFQEYMDLNNLISPEQLLRMPAKEKYTFKKTDHDVITVISSNLAKYIDETKFNKDDNKFDISQPEIKALERYLKYITREAEVVFLTHLKNRIGYLVVEFFDMMNEKYLDLLLDTHLPS